MLEKGNKNRTQHPTDANATSSRSHAVFQVQWDPSKADNLEPHILSIIVGCPLWRGCIDVNGKQSGPRNLSVIEGCPLSGVPL